MVPSLLLLLLLWYEGGSRRRTVEKVSIKNLATARGLHFEALIYENKALAAYPNDIEILEKKTGTLEILQRYSDAAQTSERLYRLSPRNNDYRNMVIEFNLLSGRQNMKQLEYDSALANYNKVLAIAPSNYDAIAYSADVYAQQKKYDEALDRIDVGLNLNPDDERLLFKRALVLQDAGLHDLAAQQAMQLHKIKRKDKRYENLVIDIKTVYAKNLMAADDYDGAREEYRTILILQPNNADALNGQHY